MLFMAITVTVDTLYGVLATFYSHQHPQYSFVDISACYAARIATLGDVTTARLCNVIKYYNLSVKIVTSIRPSYTPSHIQALLGTSFMVARISYLLLSYLPTYKIVCYIDRDAQDSNYIDEARQKNGPGNRIREPNMSTHMDNASEKPVNRGTIHHSHKY